MGAIEWLLNDYDPPKAMGRSRADTRRILDGIIFRFRTGCQWNRIPKVYRDDSTIHRTFQRWVEINLFEMVWSWLAAECDELALVHWEWQAADGWLGKARSGGDQIGPNPTDRAKNGTKKSVLVDVLTAQDDEAAELDDPGGAHFVTPPRFELPPQIVAS